MPRPLRLIVPGVPHHVVHGGNDGQPFLSNAADRRLYLELFEQRCIRYGVSIAGFALIPNHVHHIAIPEAATSLSHAVRDAHGQFARIINRRARRNRLVFHPRFWASPMDDLYALASLRYIELNPLQARLCVQPQGWAWSSAAFHLGLGARPSIISAEIRPPSARKPDVWAEFLRAGIKPDWVRILKRRLARGVPLGSDEFVTETLAQHSPSRRVRLAALASPHTLSSGSPTPRRSRAARRTASNA